MSAEFKRVETILDAAADVKAEQMVALDLRKLEAFTDYFIIASGRSDRQVKAIADKIVERGKEQLNEKPLSIEGYDEGHWIILDYGDVMAHIFYEETREYYRLEELWHEAESLVFPGLTTDSPVKVTE